MENELIIRLGFFFGIFALLALAEAVAPRRDPRIAKGGRWRTNWIISIANTLTLRIVAIAFPLLAVGAAADASNLGFGLLNAVQLPILLEWIIAILVLDALIWFQHMITHKIPLLWRLHRVHHADREMDVTTAIRFHPVEIGLSMILKIGAIYVLGPAIGAVILFEILLNGCAMFNHANLNLPKGLDRWLRLIIVTPDMHRVHHSVDRAEHDSNYGFSLSIWDRLFGTYIAQPRDGHDNMTIGLEWQDDSPAKLGWSLKLPFIRDRS